MTNQPNLEALHDIAMEFAEEASFAHKRGEVQTAKLFYQKAFNLEKTYALSFPTKPTYLLSRAVFLRSAAYLALNSGYLKEAANLAKLGLGKTPHPDFIEEFQSLIKQAKSSKKEATKEINIQGILTFADLANKQIKIKDLATEQLYTIHVSNASLEELVLSFWAQAVYIKGIADKKGVIQLAEIRRAA